MSNIKIFNIDFDDQIDNRYVYPQDVVLTNLDESNIKLLLQYCLPVCESNPSFPQSKHPYIGINTNIDMIVIDKSRKKYRVSAGTSFQIIGIYTQFYDDMFNFVSSVSNAQLDQSPYTWPDDVYNVNSRGPANSIVPWNKSGSIIFIKNIPYQELINDINLGIRHLYANLSLSRLNHIKSNKYTQQKFLPMKIVKTHHQKKYMGDDIAKLFGLDKQSIPIDIYYQVGLFGWWNLLDKSALNGTKLNKNIPRMINAPLTFYKYLGSKYKNELKIARLNKLVRLSNFDGKYEDLTPDLVKIIDNKYALMTFKVGVKFDVLSLNAISLLRQAIDNVHRTKGDVIEQLKNVTKLFNIKKTQLTSMYAPKKYPKQKILCPHFIDHANKIIASDITPSGEVDAYKIRLVISKTWALESKVHYNYFCKICGELILVEDMEFVNIHGTTSESYSEVTRDNSWRYIYSETMQMLNLVKSGKKINNKKFARKISDILAPQLEIVKDILQKVKTMSIMDIYGEIQLASVIYIFAIMSHYINTNPKLFSWDVKIKGSKDKKGKKGKASSPLTIAYALLLTTKDYLIKNHTAGIREKIRSDLTYAYTWVLNSGDVVNKIDLEQSDNLTKLIGYHYMIHDPLWDASKIDYILTHNKTVDNFYYKKFLVGVKHIEKDYLKSQAWINGMNPSNLWIKEIFNWFKFKDNYKTPITSISDELREEYKNVAYDIDDANYRKWRIQFMQTYISFHRKLPQFITTGSKYKKLTEREKLNNFYNQYGKLCPGYGTDTIVGHNWTFNDKNLINSKYPCKKCKIMVEDIINHNVKYYTKWKSLPTKLNITIIAPVKKILKPKGISWKHTTTNILKISKITTPKYTYNMWLNLGLFEGQTYLDVRSGKTVFTDQQGSIERLNKINGYFQKIMHKYEYLRWNTRIIQTRTENTYLMDVLDEKDRILLVQLHSKSKIIDDIDSAINYALTKLCKYLIDISLLGTNESKLTKHGKKFFLQFFKDCVDDLFRFELLSSKLEAHKRTNINTYGKKDNGGDVNMLQDMDSEDAEYISNINTIMDQNNLSLEDANDYISADPFSYADVDIESTNTGQEHEEFLN